MRTAIVIVMQDGSVLIVQNRTMVLVEAVIVVLIALKLHQFHVNAQRALVARIARYMRNIQKYIRVLLFFFHYVYCKDNTATQRIKV